MTETNAYVVAYSTSTLVALVLATALLKAHIRVPGRDPSLRRELRIPAIMRKEGFVGVFVRVAARITSADRYRRTDRVLELQTLVQSSHKKVDVKRLETILLTGARARENLMTALRI